MDNPPRAETYCFAHFEQGGKVELILADMYGGLGSHATSTEEYEAMPDYFTEQWNYTQLAIRMGKLVNPTFYDVLGLGGNYLVIRGSGLQS